MIALKFLIKSITIYLFTLTISVVLADSSLLYEKLRQNEAVVTEVSETNLTISQLAYDFNPDYSRIYKTDSSNTSFNIISLVESIDPVTNAKNYQIQVEHRDRSKPENRMINLKNYFSINEKIYLSVIAENSFNSRISGIAGELSYFVAKPQNGEADFSRRNLWSYRYLFNEDAKKAYTIKEMLKDTERQDNLGTYHQPGATTIFINGVRDNNLSNTFYLSGSYFSNNRIEDDYLYENTATIISRGLAGSKTYIEVANFKYDFQGNYDVIYSHVSNSEYSIEGIALNQYRREVTVDGEVVSETGEVIGHHIIYLPGDVRYNFSVGDHIQLGKRYEYSAAVTHKELRNEFTYLTLSSFAKPIEPGEYDLLSIKRSQKYAVEAIDNQGLYIEGIVNHHFDIGDVIKLVPRFPHILSMSNGQIFLNNQPVLTQEIIINNNYNVQGNVIIPEDYTLNVSPSGRIQIESGNQLTIKGKIIAEQRKIFFGTGDLLGQPTASVPGLVSTISFSVIPQWWGVKGDGVTNNTVPFNRFARALQNNWTAYIPEGDYILDSGGVIFKDLKNVTIIGANTDTEEKTRLRPSQQRKYTEIPISSNTEGCEDDNSQKCFCEVSARNTTGCEESYYDNNTQTCFCYGVVLPESYYSAGVFKPVSYFTTLSIDQSQDIQLKNMTIESRGRYWGDTDTPPSNFNAYGTPRTNWIIKGGGSALLVSRSNNITLDTLENRLAGSVGVVYLSSADNINTLNAFANAGDLGYAGFAADNWADAYINTNGRYYFGHCTSHTETGIGNLVYKTSGKAGIVVEGDSGNELFVTIEGGVFRDAISGGDFPSGGNGVAADTTHLTMRNAVLTNNRSGLRLHAKATSAPLTIDIDNNQIVANSVSAIFSEFKNTDNNLTIANNHLSVSANSAWNFGTFQDTARMYPVIESALMINNKPFFGEMYLTNNQVEEGSKKLLLPLQDIETLHVTTQDELANWFNNYAEVQSYGLANDMTYLDVEMALPIGDEQYIFNGQFYKVQHSIRLTDDTHCQTCYRLFLSGDVRYQFIDSHKKRLGLYSKISFAKVSAQVISVGLANTDTFVDIISEISPLGYNFAYSDGIYAIAGFNELQDNCDNCYRLFFQGDVRNSFASDNYETNFIGLYLY
ncbi:MAG: hypothetical protein AAGB12_02215 [Pseudomonadota bacterium]